MSWMADRSTQLQPALGPESSSLANAVGDKADLVSAIIGLMELDPYNEGALCRMHYSEDF